VGGREGNVERQGWKRLLLVLDPFVVAAARSSLRPHWELTALHHWAAELMSSALLHQWLFSVLLFLLLYLAAFSIAPSTGSRN